MTKTVLLIDYDPRSISRLRTLLNTAGYHTIVAHNAEQGRAEFESAKPHLTLIQDLLPKGHGFEICRELKALPHGRKTPIVLLTAPRSGGRRHELLRTRCDDFVVKPFTDDGLLGVVRRIVPPEPASASKMRRKRTESGSMVAASSTTDENSPDIPVEFTEDDVGSRLDSILLGSEPSASEGSDKRGKRSKRGNGKQRSLKTFLGFGSKEA